jgi:tetratricopeptide (TPR) repeat protein
MIVMDDSLRQLLTLGKELYVKRDFQGARTVLERITERSQAFADVYNMLGVIYHDAGMFTKAEEALQKALEVNPAYSEAALNLAVLFNDLGRYAEASKVYAAALHTTRRAPGELEAHVAGKIANMHADLGDAYRAAGRLPEAIVEYRKAVALGPRFVDLRVLLAGALRDSGDHAAAVTELLEALREKPEYHPARNQLGLCLYASDNVDGAVAAWKQVLEVEPSNLVAGMYLKLVAGAKR